MNLLHTLTKGWFIRGFYLLVLVPVLYVRFTVGLVNVDNKQVAFVYALALLAVNALCYVKISWQVVALTKQSLAAIIPYYHQKIKRALYQLILVSLLPALLLLPNIQLFFSLISVQLMLICLIVLCYLFPTIYGLVLILLVGNVFIQQLLQTFNIGMSNETAYFIFIELTAYCLPIWLFFSVYSIHRLEHLQVSEKLIKYIKMSFTADAFKLKAMRDEEVTSDNVISQFFQRIRLGASTRIRKQLLTTKNNKVDLLSVANEAFLFSSRENLAVAGLFMFSVYIMLQFDLFTLHNSVDGVFLFALSGSVMACSLLHIVSHFWEKKSYLSRLRLTPLFNDEQDFTTVLLKSWLLLLGRCFFSVMVIMVFSFELFLEASALLYFHTIFFNVIIFCVVFALSTLFVNSAWLSRWVLFLIILVCVVPMFALSIAVHHYQYMLPLAWYLVIAVLTAMTVVYGMKRLQRQGVHWQLS